jgi:hypothetical protein
MNLKELMKVDVENLRLKQNEAIKEHIISTLHQVITLVSKDKFKEVEQLLEHSPAGDGMGSENNFINFKFDECSLDILEIINLIK